MTPRNHYLTPLYRALSATIKAACDSGQPTVAVAKDRLRYAPEYLDHLDRAVQEQRKRDLTLAYDVYYRLIVQGQDDEVLHLTNRSRSWWLRWERQLEKNFDPPPVYNT